MPRRTIAIAALLLAAATLVGAEQAIQVTPLVRDGHVYVSFQLSDAFENEEIRDAIHSGLKITFVYDVELRRSAAAWLHRTIESSTVSAGVRYDNLARRYQVTLNADGRTEDSRTLDRESLAREWLTRFDRLDLFPTHGSNRTPSTTSASGPAPRLAMRLSSGPGRERTSPGWRNSPSCDEIGAAGAEPVAKTARIAKNARGLANLTHRPFRH